MPAMTIGLDISKSWFQVHGITQDGEIIRRKLARGKVLDFFARLAGWTCFALVERHFGQFTASLSNWAGLEKSSAEWRLTGL